MTGGFKSEEYEAAAEAVEPVLTTELVVVVVVEVGVPEHGALGYDKVVVIVVVVSVSDGIADTVTVVLPSGCPAGNVPDHVPAPSSERGVLLLLLSVAVTLKLRSE
jgi:hypothetical protein